MTPPIILELCERFERDEKRYKSDSYNEAQLRQDFLNPLFKELGWDVYHEQRATLSHREVKVEVPVKLGTERGFLDYAFCVDGRAKFVVEAKKPWVDINSHLEAAKQLRRYGWNQKLGLSILTNFREFAIYDCTAKPSSKDAAKDYRLKLFSYQDLKVAENWQWIADRFSKKAVHGGFLDEYAAKKSGKRGSAQVDESLLEEIDKWRADLADNIYKKNEGIDVAELNYIIGKIVDRIIFLRVCEDRGIEPYETLLNLVQKGGAYPRLVEYFYKADERYNSGLFHFKDDPKRGEHPDLTTPLLKVDDVVMQSIIRGLYYPKSQFLFSEIPIEILGHVYEQFLGKVIRLEGKGKRKTVEIDFKPEVRKAGGVYYTPTYIVDYIVKHTVGKIVDGKTPDEVSKLRVLDPACGSGSFLIGAYQFLLDWHLTQYTEAPLNPPKSADRFEGRPESSLEARPSKLKGVRGNIAIYETAAGWRLTLEERKRILLNNIYGVDIDAQAVEVTKLSLLLKVLEDASPAEIEDELSAKHHALPDLGKNIKCGNSLVGSDIRKVVPEVTEAELKVINPFDWKLEFKDVFKQGGFDAVIGNPPYVRPHRMENYLKEYLWESTQSFRAKSDLYCCFIEKGVNHLRKDGLLGYIVSDGWLRLDSFVHLRQFLLKSSSINEIVELPYGVFRAQVKPCLLMLSKGIADEKHEVTVRSVETVGAVDATASSIEQNAFESTYLNVFDLSISPVRQKVLDKMLIVSTRLDENASISFGLKTGDDKKFIVKSTLSKLHKKLLRGANIQRYSAAFNGEYVCYDPAAMRAHRKTARPGTHERFEQPKVLVRDTTNLLTSWLDRDSFYVKDVLIVTSAKFDYCFLVGLLNSKLLSYYYIESFPTIHVQNSELAQLPIRTINFKDKTDKARHDKMVKLVERMLELNKKLPEVKTPNEREKMERQIAATDREIDELVYELYNLTPEEIEIVEGTQRGPSLRSG